jgi:hypothetical protein
LVFRDEAAASPGSLTPSLRTIPVVAGVDGVVVGREEEEDEEEEDEVAGRLEADGVDAGTCWDDGVVAVLMEFDDSPSPLSSATRELDELSVDEAARADSELALNDGRVRAGVTVDVVLVEKLRMSLPETGSADEPDPARDRSRVMSSSMFKEAFEMSKMEPIWRFTTPRKPWSLAFFHFRWSKI